MARRIGRNDPCHCGSGLKLKRCHIVARRIPPIRPEIVESELDRLLREKYNEIVQETRHFPSNLIPYIIKKRLLKWYKSLIEKGET